jgi:flavin reductase (DIM6/NTAB) family NADH-FMN oxidoreductase RutF
MTMSGPVSVSGGVRDGVARPGEQAGDFRMLMSRFPTGVAVVTALDRSGVAHGMTCNSLSSVTLRPPTLLVCLGIGSGTLAAVRAGGGFAVNLLHAGARRTAEVFSSAEPDRFGQVAWVPSQAVGAPWLTDDAFALAECRVSRTVEVGDHEVVFGEVVRAVSTEHQGTPLLYGMRCFSAWTAPGAPEPGAGHGANGNGERRRG